MAWYFGKLKNILLNLRYRIVALILEGLFIVFLLIEAVISLPSYETQSVVVQLVIIVGYFIMFLFPCALIFRSLDQITDELILNDSILYVRVRIRRQRKMRREAIDVRSLQVSINNVRDNLRMLMNASKIISPPIYNYELDRVQKRIDIFFNTISEVLFPITRPFSRAEEYEEYLSRLEYESQEHPTGEELAEEYEAEQKEETGEIDSFDRDALDEFMRYLGNALFARIEPYSAFSQRHSIDLIMLSNFFERWNSVLSQCDNCKGVFEKVTKDIEEYYKVVGRREREQRQRMQRLRDDILIVAISVILSTVVQYLIAHAH